MTTTITWGGTAVLVGAVVEGAAGGAATGEDVMLVAAVPSAGTKTGLLAAA